jgi:hypothetical protein
LRPYELSGAPGEIIEVMLPHRYFKDERLAPGGGNDSRVVTHRVQLSQGGVLWVNVSSVLAGAWSAAVPARGAHKSIMCALFNRYSRTVWLM